MASKLYMSIAVLFVLILTIILTAMAFSGNLVGYTKERVHYRTVLLPSSQRSITELLDDGAVLLRFQSNNAFLSETSVNVNVTVIYDLNKAGFDEPEIFVYFPGAFNTSDFDPNKSYNNEASIEVHQINSESGTFNGYGEIFYTQGGNFGIRVEVQEELLGGGYVFYDLEGINVIRIAPQETILQVINNNGIYGLTTLALGFAIIGILLQYLKSIPKKGLE